MLVLLSSSSFSGMHAEEIWGARSLKLSKLDQPIVHKKLNKLNEVPSGVPGIIFRGELKFFKSSFEKLSALFGMGDHHHRGEVPTIVYLVSS